MQKLRLDILKLAGAKHFTSKDGIDHIAIPVAESNIYVGAKGSYLELTVHDNKGGVDQYGNEGFISVDIGKERSMGGEKGPILGNWKHVGPRNESAPRQESYQSSSPQTGGGAGDDQSDIPF
jgi:hypothetical protein